MANVRATTVRVAPRERPLRNAQAQSMEIERPEQGQDYDDHEGLSRKVQFHSSEVDFAASEPSIQQSLRQLIEELRDTKDLLESLGERLAPVLRAEYASDVAGMKEMGPNETLSAINIQVATANLVNRSTRNLINELIDRLDI